MGLRAEHTIAGAPGPLAHAPTSHSTATRLFCCPVETALHPWQESLDDFHEDNGKCYQASSDTAAYRAVPVFKININPINTM